MPVKQFKVTFLFFSLILPRLSTTFECVQLFGSISAWYPKKLIQVQTSLSSIIIKSWVFSLILMILSCLYVGQPDITAPGVNILAATTALDPSMDGGYAMRSGTSMATPHISGIVALLKALHPNWSPAAIKSALFTTGTPILIPFIKKIVISSLPFKRPFI